MFKHRKMRFNGEWSLLAGNRVYELMTFFRCKTSGKSNKQTSDYLKHLKA
jgi:hypothetical protein